MLTLLPLVLPLVLNGPAPARPADATALLRAVPADALGVLAIHDFDGLRADAADSAWLAVLEDSAFAPLWEQLEALEEQMRQDASVPLDPERLLASLRGPAVAFMTVDGSRRFAGGLLIEAGGDNATFNGIFQALTGMLSANAEAWQEMHGETTLLMVSDDPDDEDGTVGAFFQHGALSAALVGDGIGTVQALARGVLDRYGAAGAGGGFGGALLGEARGVVGGQRRVELVFDLQKLIAIGMAEDPPDEEDRAAIEALGVADFRWAYLGAQLGKGEHLDLDWAMGLPRKGFLREVFGFARPAPQRLARMLPVDSTAASLMGFDIWGLWQAGWKFAESLAPEKVEEARAQLEMASDQMGLDLEADFLSQLTGELAVVNVLVPKVEWLRGELPMFGGGRAGELTDVEERMPGSAFLVGVEDPGIVQGFLEDVFNMIGVAERLDSERIGEVEVHSFELDEDVSFSWAFGDRVALLSLHPTAMRTLAPRLVGAPESSVLDHETFGPLLRSSGPACSVAVGSTPWSLRTTLMSLRAAMELGGGREHVRYLPRASVIDRYFRGTMSSTVQIRGDNLHASNRAR